MDQDTAKGRRTEIEYLNGFVVREGEQVGIAALANERLVDIVKKIERGELEQDPRHITELRLNQTAWRSLPHSCERGCNQIVAHCSRRPRESGGPEPTPGMNKGQVTEITGFQLARERRTGLVRQLWSDYNFGSRYLRRQAARAAPGPPLARGRR
jgi:hypothetical protein